MTRKIHTVLAALLMALSSAAAGAQPPKPAGKGVVARLETRDVIVARLAKGHQAILLMGQDKIDEKICRVFMATYGDTIVDESDRTIYFARKKGAPPQAVDCEQLINNYDVRIRSDLLQQLSMQPVMQDRILMIVCTDAEKNFINKGYVRFGKSDDNDVILAKFLAFERHYRKGPSAWTDDKVIDERFEILRIPVQIWPKKNTRCV